MELLDSINESKAHLSERISENSSSMPKVFIFIFLWVVLIHGIWLLTGLDATLPFSIFFYGDSQHFLEQSRHIAQGKSYNANLPFHPPLTAWLLVPLWWIFSQQQAVWVAAKVLMIVINGLTISFLYVLMKKVTRYAFLLCLLIPLNFGELILSSSVNSECLYSFLLVFILWLGFRFPFVGGLFHAMACLTRAEHLWLVIFIFCIGISIKSKRRFVLTSFLGCMVILGPFTIQNARNINVYNQEFKEKLKEPLPFLVPISLYGPLNFALAQNDESIFFSRSSLPTPERDEVSLDPLFPAHNNFINHGYMIGLRQILSDPIMWVKNMGLKCIFSIRILSYGWTWRDFPNKMTWLRSPVDMANSFSVYYFFISLILIVIGGWRLRNEPLVLVIGLILVFYRLGINCLFFPYLRSMMIVGPFLLCLILIGFSGFFRRWQKHALIVVLIVMFFVHAFTLMGKRDYYIEGKSDQHHQIIQDDELTIKYVGFYRPQGEEP